jgi:hypothetical protein
MKIRLIYILLTVFSLQGWTQNTPKSSISIDFGSFRNRYLYPITNIRFQSSAKENFTYTLRLRSYGTLYFFSQTAYDFTAIGEYKLISKNSFALTSGVGFNTRIRLDKDKRGAQENSIEPILAITPKFQWKKFNFNIPLWTQFYVNGIGLTLLPEIHYFFNQKWSVYGRYELSYLQQYNATNHQFQQDCFVGIQKIF